MSCLDMDESGNRCILDMVNHIDLWTEDDCLIDSLLLEPRIHQSSEDDNRPRDSSRMAETETSTSGNLEAVRASAQKSGQASNVEGSSAGKRLRIKSATVSKGSMSPRNGLNSRSTSSATPVKKASLGSKNVGMSMRSTGGIEAPVLKARASSSSRNMVSNPTPSTMKVLKTASSLGNGSTTSQTLKSPLDSSKGKESLRRSSSGLSHSTVKTPPTVASRSIHSADKKSVRSPLNAQKSLPSQSVGGLLNSPPGMIASGQSKLSRLKTAGPSTSISSNKPVKLTPARTRSGTFATPSPRKEASVGRSLLRATSKQTIGQGSSNSSSSSLLKKKTGITSFPNKQVRTKCAGTPPLKVSKITPIDAGNETGDVFLVTVGEDDMSRLSDAKPPHNSITKRKSSLPVGSHVVAARVPLSSRNSLCNSSDSIHASKVQKLVILSLPKNS